MLMRLTTVATLDTTVKITQETRKEARKIFLIIVQFSS